MTALTSMQLIQKMSRYTGNHVRKNYFTKSTSSLPSPHPKQEFLSIINIKKHYQSIIKQELNALEMIDNAETKELSSWQQQLCNKQTKIQEFILKQSPYQMPLAIKREEKTPQELRECYEQVRFSKISKAFKEIVSIMTANHRRQVRKRAAKYLYRQNTLKVHFNTWIFQTHQDPSIKASLQMREQLVKDLLRKQYVQHFVKQRATKERKSSLLFKLQLIKKRRFIDALAELASYKYTQITADQQIKKILKRVFFSHAKSFLLQRKASQSLRQMQRLLENIYCHRRLNSFFNAYRQIKFQRQQSKITGSIINKIDLFQLVEQTEDDQTLQQADGQEEGNRRKIRIKTERVNTGLLSLILQNFIDEYSQEYEYPLSEEEFHNFLHELKSQCARRLVLNHGKKTVFKYLSFNRKVIALTGFLNKRKRTNTIEQLCLHSRLRQKQLSLITNILVKNITCFSRETLRRKNFKRKLTEIKSSTLAQKLIKKFTIHTFYSFLAERRKLTFKKKVADNWRCAQLSKRVLNCWRTYNECQSQVTPYEQDQSYKNNNDIFDDYYQQSSKPTPKPQQPEDKNKEDEMISNEVQQDEYGTNSRSRAKQQLSKIVNIIGRGLPDKSSFYSSKKSSQSQSSNKPTIRLNTQSDHQQPIQSQDKLQSQKELFPQEYTLLYKQLKRIRLVEILRGMKKRLQQYNKLKKLNNVRIKRKLKQAQQKYLDNKNIKINMISVDQNVLVRHRKRFVRNLRNDYAFGRSLDQLQSFALRKNKAIKDKTLRNSISFAKYSRQLQEKQLKAHQLLMYQKKNLKLSVILYLDTQTKYKRKQRQLTKFVISSYCIRIFNKLKLHLEEKSSQNEQIEHAKQHSLVQSQLSSPPKQIQPSNQAIRHQVFQEGHPSLSDLLHSEKPERSNLNCNEKNVEVQADSYHQLKQQAQKSQVSCSQNEEIWEQKDQQELRNYLFRDNIEPSSQQPSLVQNSQPQETKQIQEQNRDNYEEGGKQLEGQAWLAYTIERKLQTKQNMNSQASLSKQQLNLSPVNKQLPSLQPTASIQQPEIQSPQSQSQLSRSSIHTQHTQQEQASYQQEMSQLMEMRKRLFVQRLVDNLEYLEQQRIKQEERENIVKFNLANKAHRLKKKAFEGLYSLIEDRWSRKVKQICFRGWKMFSSQKKMLRHYFEMQVQSSRTNMCYYPHSIQEKKAFQQLRAS